MATWFAGTGGNDGSAGTSYATRFLTPAHGRGVMGTSDVLFVTAGTYDDAMNSDVPSGSAGNYSKVHAYPGHTVWFKPSNSPSVAWVIYFGGPLYVEFNAINLDSSNGDATNRMGGISVFADDSHHIRFQNAEILGNRAAGDLSNSRVGCDFNGGFPATLSLGYNELINCEIHGSAGNNSYYGVYIHTSHNTVDGCNIYDTGMLGVTLYNAYGISETATDNVIRNNRVHDIVTAFNSNRIGIQPATNTARTQIYNNLIWNINTSDTGAGNGLSFYSCVDSSAWYNTIYNVHGDSINYFNSANSTFIGNILYGNTANSPVDAGSNTGVTQLDNLAGINPLFVDAAAADFTLQAGSVAIGAGTPVAQVSTDIVGAARPMSVYTIGAYEPTGVVGGGGVTLIFGENTGNTTGVEETAIWADDPTTNHNGEAQVDIYNYLAGTHRHTLFRATGIASITPSAVVSAAQLRVYLLGASAGTPTLSCFPVLRAWTPAGVTWNKYDGVSNWGVAGALDATDIGSAVASAVIPGNVPAYYTWSGSALTALVQGWVNGSIVNNGVMLQRTDGADDYQYEGWSGSEGTDGQRPEFEVTYTADIVTAPFFPLPCARPHQAVVHASRW